VCIFYFSLKIKATVVFRETKKDMKMEKKKQIRRNFAGGWNGIKNLLAGIKFASKIVPLTSQFVRTQS